MEMIPARDVIDVHEQHFVVIDEWLLLSRKAFAQCTCSVFAA
jgi:hypothetical protein